MTPRRSWLNRSVWVRTDMPDATDVVQEAGKPCRPSISTKQTRQDPNASKLSVAQSLGMEAPASAAARMIDVPAGTEISCPSIQSVTRGPAGVTALVPRSISPVHAMVVTPQPRAHARGQNLLENSRVH